MKLASYKGTRPGIAALFSIGVRWWLSGQYSHTEIVFSDGMCGSSSWVDGGVRLKRIDITPEKWDTITLNGDEAKARAWYESHAGQKFDLIGLLGFVVRRGTQSRGKWFCSESCAAALGFTDPHRFDPCSLPVVLRHRGAE